MKPVMLRFFCHFSILCLTVIFTGCGDSGPGVELKNASKEEARDIQATEPLSLKIEEFTGNHTKIVWAKYVGSKGDVFANGNQLELWGIDTRDDKGAHKIIEAKGNYSRPLISPDGKAIIFSSKNMTRVKEGGKEVKHFEPYIYRVDWEGTKIEKLGPGYASDVWADPNTGVYWVYRTDILPTDRSAMRGAKLDRFKLYDQDDIEVVWDKTEIGPDNIQLSRDGKRASALFPWPHAGVLDIDKNEQWKNQHGCWPSLAPDDSYVAWVFDGAHKNLHFFTDRTKKTWIVPVNGGPNIKGNEVYHPRWSNHVRFFAMSGPYIGKTIGSGVGHVNIYLGNFSKCLDNVDHWLQITDDGQDDYYPDLWVASGDGASVSDPSLVDAADDEDDLKLWPRGGNERLLFLWENGKKENKAANERRCSVDARDQARFGPNFEMLADGGYFEADKESGEILSRHGVKKARTTIELIATANDADQRGTVFSHDQFQIQQRGDEWVFVSAEPKLIGISLGKVEVGKPTHLAASFEKAQGWKAFEDGKEIQTDGDGPAPDMKASRSGMTFGSGWSGSIEGIAIYADNLKKEEVEGNLDYFERNIAKRKAIPRIKIRAKLIEATPARSLEDLDTYQRGLLGYYYEVEEVIEGALDAKEVIVIHFTTMDRTPLTGFPRRPGQSYELILEPKALHPELTSEREWNDIFAPDINVIYFDVATPQP